MQLICKNNKGYRFLLFVIDNCSKYAYVVLLKDKKGIIITNVMDFQNVLDQSGCKPNKIWVDRGNEFCKGSMKSLLQDNGIEIYSSHKEKSEGKSVVAERFIRTLNNTIYKYLTSVSENV